jgi:hypothetical protein
MSSPEVTLLRDRVERLDADPLPVPWFDTDPRLLHFVAVMTTYTHTSMTVPPGGRAIVAPAEADEITATCGLLDDIVRDEAGLVRDPLPRSRQHWIGTGRDDPAPALAKASFVSAHTGPRGRPSTKPFGLGLYTSTATRQGHSMWRIYLELSRGSSLFPRPWSTWEVQAPREAVSVLEITGAREWAGFVAAYADEHRGLIYPDWRRVAADHDGVHLTLSAVVATQGFNFPTPAGITAATYWDIESTLWLRWRFTSVRLVDVVGVGATPGRPPGLPHTTLPRPPERHAPPPT